MIKVLIISCFMFVAITIFCILKLRYDKYVKYLNNNSISLKSLLIINKDFSFYTNIKNFDECHTYDNSIFYNNISCEDFLIYQLQYKKCDIEKEIQKVKINKINYDKYCTKISEIKNLGEYVENDPKLNKSYLLKIENKLFSKNILKPTIDFNVKIILYCSKINGDIYQKKTENFSSEHILLLIKRLNNKNRNFYNDKGIWDSLCRVERGKVSNKMRFSIYQRDGYRCCICGRTERHDYLEIDHIKPISKGGKSTYDNLQTLCRRCNKNKGDSF